MGFSPTSRFDLFQRSVYRQFAFCVYPRSSCPRFQPPSSNQTLSRTARSCQLNSLQHAVKLFEHVPSPFLRLLNQRHQRFCSLLELPTKRPICRNDGLAGAFNLARDRTGGLTGSQATCDLRCTLLKITVEQVLDSCSPECDISIWKQCYC